jgi:hypothetical protein
MVGAASKFSDEIPPKILATCNCMIAFGSISLPILLVTYLSLCKQRRHPEVRRLGLVVKFAMWFWIGAIMAGAWYKNAAIYDGDGSYNPNSPGVFILF